MTKERSEEVLLIAIVLSVALHILLMVYAKPRVMTHVVGGISRQERRAPMRVTGELPKMQPVKIDAIKDVQASKPAPEAKSVESLVVPGLEGTGEAPALPEAVAAAALAESVKPKSEEAYRFSEEALKLDKRGSIKIPVVEVEVPSAQMASASEGFGGASPVALPVAAPEFVASKAPAAMVPMAEKPVVEPAREKLVRESAGTSFTPPSEVFEKVDERIVELEKAAVRELVDAPDAEELSKFVNVTASAKNEGQWTYFKVMFSPRRDLQTVPKDFVVLIDASGSIGKDRMNSIRSAARRILRSATNSGDRFNLVAFRDRYSYAFRSWQECTAESFARSDKWLAAVAAHGRTDVFATIRSVLTLPRSPERPLIALVITDGEANEGVSSTAQILSKFTALNDGLISVYMYGVRSSGNRELIDTLTRGNRGESFIYDGMRFRAGSGIEGLTERFRDPVLSDLRVVFSAGTAAEAYPRRLRNLYRGGVLELTCRVPAGTKEIAFSLKGLNAKRAHEGFFRIPLTLLGADSSIPTQWQKERNIDLKLR